MQKLNPWSSETGSALVFALVFGIVMSIMGIVGLQLIVGGSAMNRRTIEVIKSFWANEGALRISYRYVTCVAALPQTSIAPFTVTPAVVLNGYTPNNSIFAIANSNGTAYSYTCSTTTLMPAVNLQNTTVCGSVSINSMSRYTWFETQTSAATWAAMIVHGDFHSNGYINALSSMTNEIHVTGKATTAGRISPNQTYDRANFPAPYQNGFRIRSDNGSDLTTETSSWFQSRIPNYGSVGTIQTTNLAPSAAAFTNGYTISTSSAVDSIGIQLNGTSVTIWSLNHQSGAWTQTDNQSIANITGGILKSSKPTYVWGTLDGKLTIVSNTPTGATNASDIVIGGNITYANTNLSTSNDVLALVSAADVVIYPKTNNTTTGMVHDFTQSGATVYGSLFMSNGHLDVQNISNSNTPYTSLVDFNVYGGVLLSQSAGTYYSGSTARGIRAQYYQDPRFVGNAALAPGIPYANATDPERGGTSSMYVLGNGTWVNRVSAQ